MAYACSGCGMMGYGWGFFGVITWLLVVLALIVFVMWMLKHLGKK